MNSGSEEVLRAGVKDHLVPVKFLAEKIPAQAAGIIAANPFATAIRKMPASFSEEDRKRLTEAITTTIEKEVFPAYKQFAAFITTDYAPNGRTTLSISSPAQACSYKLGKLKIRDLRKRAAQQLGSKFDVRTFHDAILAGGSLPLEVLDARITRWINAQY